MKNSQFIKKLPQFKKIVRKSFRVSLLKNQEQEKVMKEYFKPHIASKTIVKEFTFRAIVLGVILGLIFAVGNEYLGLKIGTTVSASIPAAVFSMAIFRLFKSKASVLENNLVQTIVS